MSRLDGGILVDPIGVEFCFSPFLSPYLALQDLLSIDAPKRHKVSVHVLSREMDSCKYLPKFVCAAENVCVCGIVQ